MLSDYGDISLRWMVKPSRIISTRPLSLTDHHYVDVLQPPDTEPVCESYTFRLKGNFKSHIHACRRPNSPQTRSVSSEQVGSHTMLLFRRSSTAASSADMVLTHTQSEGGSATTGDGVGSGVTGAGVAGVTGSTGAGVAGVTGSSVTGAGVTGTGAGVAGTGASVTGAGVTGAGVTGAGVTGAGVSGKMPKGASVPSEVVTVDGAGVSGNKVPRSDGEGVGLLVSIESRISSQVMQRPCWNFGRGEVRGKGALVYSASAVLTWYARNYFKNARKTQAPRATSKPFLTYGYNYNIR